MRIEALCTGDELLTGLTTDTNTTFFSGRLFAIGEQLARVQVVGDDRKEIVAALRRAADEADLLLVSGGLGPTADDLTAECAAETAGVPLVEDAGVRRALEARFAERKLTLTPNNLKQALVPKGAEVRVAPIGSAPMFILSLGRCTVCFVAGVPREYRHWVDAEVMPRVERLRARDPNRIHRTARLLKTVGIAESHLDAEVAKLAGNHPNVSFGFRTQLPENHLKLVASGASPEAAKAALTEAEKAVRSLIEQRIFGQEEDTLAGVVGKLLQTRRATVAVAESCTGGRISELLTAPSGASGWFLGGVVAYSNAMKTRWAGVAPEQISAHGAVSAEVAESLASGARAAAGATYGLSATGIAGPTGATDGKPVGTVYIGLAGPEGVVHRALTFRGDREMIRAFTAHAAVDLLRRELSGTPA